MAWSELFALARRRHGVVGLADAGRVGLDASTLARRALAEHWLKLFPGVWLVPGVEVSALNQTAAAILACEGGVAARESALWLHGVRDRPPPRPQLLVPYGTRGPTSGRRVEVVRTRALPPHHRTRTQRIPATIVERGVFDLAGRYDRRRLRSVVIDAQHRAGLSLEVLSDLRRQYGKGRRGIRDLDAVLSTEFKRSGSGWEMEVREGISALGVEVHPGPFPYRCRDGVVIELDIALPRHWVVIECDGRAYHSDPRPFATDRLRWTQLVKDWHPVWVTYDRWRDHRAAVLTDVLDAVRAADLSRAPAVPARRSR